MNETNKYSEAGHHDETDIGQLDAVSYSSCRIAASRAMETERGKNALVKDPLARILASTAWKERCDKFLNKEEDSTWRIAIRTKYFDDYIESQRFDTQQIVLLGAGMDSRAHRLLLNDVDKRFYELDQQQVLSHKVTLLTDALHHHLDENYTIEELKSMINLGNRRTTRISCNLESDEGRGWKNQLLSSQFDPTLPSLWVLEGLTYYLTNDDVVANIFSTMSELSANGSSFICSIATSASVQRASKSSDKLMQSWKWGIDDPKEFLEQTKCGSWICQDVVGLGEEKANYNRYPKNEPVKSCTPNINVEKKRGIFYVTAKKS